MSRFQTRMTKKTSWRKHAGVQWSQKEREKKPRVVWLWPNARQMKIEKKSEVIKWIDVTRNSGRRREHIGKNSTTSIGVWTASIAL